MNSKLLIIVQGPTAIGKTLTSIQLANYYNTEIISCDSRQFYKELLIGSAPPNKQQLKEIKHHFIQHLSVEDIYNVGKFENDAIKKINQLLLIHNKIIMVGGSGLYINAICKGFDKIPEVSEKMRARIVSLYQKNGIKFLQQELYDKDKEYFEKVDKQNPQRLMRALEVIYSTRKTFSSFRTRENQIRNFDIIKINLDIKRESLYNTINKRVDRMIEKGLIKEVESLIPYKEKNALQTVGYKELFEYLDGRLSLEEAIDRIKKNTRRLAKRQITWFKKDNLRSFAPEKIDEIIRFIE